MSRRFADGRWIQRAALLGLAAFGLTIGLLAAEILVRWVRPQPLSVVTPGLYQPDPPRRYRLTPGYHGTVSNGVEFTTSIVIDEHGLRDGDPPADPGATRLLVLGDSFVFGWGVEGSETFAARLAMGGAGPLVALNGGVPGYGLPDVVAWLEHYGPVLEPDLVLLALFAGNDLLDATDKHRRVVIQDGLVGKQTEARGMRAWLDRHFHLLRLVKRALPLGLRLRLRAALGLPEPWEVVYLRDSIQSFARQPPALIAEGRAATRAAFARLYALTAGAGVSLAVVVIPAALQVDDGRWQAALAQVDGDPAAYDPEVPSRFFAQLAAEYEIPYLDLLPIVRAARGDGSALYFEYDPHWNVAGHELAATAIARFLRASMTRSSHGNPTR